MSLVEQAIARMRNQARAAAAKEAAAAPSAAAAPAPPAAPPVANRVADPARVVKRITVDRMALRASGYLAEESKDKEFADHFRRIKRPLIDRAMARDARGPLRVIMVTSALPGDGKTFTSMNLALSMALERDVSVLLVDCDVAKRHVGDITRLRHTRPLDDAVDAHGVDTLVVEQCVGRGEQALADRSFSS